MTHPLPISQGFLNIRRCPSQEGRPHCLWSGTVPTAGLKRPDFASSGFACPKLKGAMVPTSSKPPSGRGFQGLGTFVCKPPSNPGNHAKSKVSLIRWARNHALFCVMPRSLWSFILEIPFKLVAMRKIAIAQIWNPSLEHSMTVAVLVLNRLRQSRHRYGMERCLVLGFTLTDPQCGQTIPSGHLDWTNHASAVLSSGNFCISSIRLIPLRWDLPGPVRRLIHFKRE